MLHELCWYSGCVVNVSCTVAEYMALPRRSRKVCERSEEDKRVVSCFVGFDFGFFLAEQITVGRFNNTYYI